MYTTTQLNTMPKHISTVLEAMGGDCGEVFKGKTDSQPNADAVTNFPPPHNWQHSSAIPG